MKATGTNTESSTSVMAMIGAVISSIARRAASAGESRVVLLQLRLDRLDHDDRVVDHDADGEHQREQRHGVGGEAERQHHGERADQRYRHGDQRDQGGAEVAEEQEDDDDDEDERLEQRVHDLLDAFLDEGRGVVGDLVVDALRERRPSAVRASCRMSSALSIALPPGDLVDADHRGRSAVQPAAGFGASRRKLDARDVAHAHERAVRIGAHDDAARIPRRSTSRPLVWMVSWNC